MDIVHGAFRCQAVTTRLATRAKRDAAGHPVPGQVEEISLYTVRFQPVTPSAGAVPGQTCLWSACGTGLLEFDTEQKLPWEIGAEYDVAITQAPKVVPQGKT